MRLTGTLSIVLAMAGIAFAQQPPASAPDAPTAPRFPTNISGAATTNGGVGGLFTRQFLPATNIISRMPNTGDGMDSPPWDHIPIGVGGMREARMGGLPASSLFGFGSLHSAEHQKKSAEATQRMSQATAMLKSESQEERVQAKKDLSAALTELFEIMTESREQQISDLEKRLKKMREQLEERNDRKKEIVDLRLQTMVNEANGLTF